MAVEGGARSESVSQAAPGTSVGRVVHSRAQCAHAHWVVLMAEVCTLLEEIFQECTLFLRVLKEIAHIF